MSLNVKYDDTSVTVYQTCTDQNADEALRHQQFSSPSSSLENITWFKSSFLWTMYQSRWSKAINQERVLAIKLNRAGCEFALANYCVYDPTHYENRTVFEEKLASTITRLRWEDDRDLNSNPIANSKAYLVGLPVTTIEKYSTEWIVEVTDVTEFCHSIGNLVRNGQSEEAKKQLPPETEYQFKDLLKGFEFVFNEMSHAHFRRLKRGY